MPDARPRIRPSRPKVDLGAERTAALDKIAESAGISRAELLRKMVDVCLRMSTTDWSDESPKVRKVGSRAASVGSQPALVGPQSVGSHVGSRPAPQVIEQPELRPDQVPTTAAHCAPQHAPLLFSSLTPKTPDPDTTTGGKRTRRASRCVSTQLPPEVSLDPQMKEAWEAHLKAARKPLTTTSQDFQLREIVRAIAAHGRDVVLDVLRDTVAAGWEGFRSSWVEQRVARNQSRGNGRAAPHVPSSAPSAHYPYRKILT